MAYLVPVPGIIPNMHSATNHIKNPTGTTQCAKNSEMHWSDKSDNSDKYRDWNEKWISQSDR